MYIDWSLVCIYYLLVSRIVDLILIKIVYKDHWHLASYIDNRSF